MRINGAVAGALESLRHGSLEVRIIGTKIMYEAHIGLDGWLCQEQRYVLSGTVCGSDTRHV